MGIAFKIEKGKIVKRKEVVSDIAHTKFSPSGANSFMHCLGFAYLGQSKTTEAAAKGTKLHEKYYKEILHIIDNGGEANPYPKFVIEEILRFKDCMVFLEVPFKTKYAGELMQGSPDACIISKDIIHVIDYKSGKFPVSPIYNKQLSIYLDIIEKNFKIKKMINYVTIWQKDNVDTWEVDTIWKNSMIDDLIYQLGKKEIEFISGDHCHKCFKKTVCPKYLKNNTLDFSF